MPKAEFGTPKWVSNKIKAAGLQKLKWYCQMCQKQCRDENGFKCHRMSEGHQRSMQIFIQNPTKFMDEFSREFEYEFMKLMKTRYCRTRVLANSVYQNIVSDRQHIHMNSTIWVTLSEFVQYLGSTNKCKIDKTEKGWYIEYIDHEELKKKTEKETRRKIELSQEEAKMRGINKMIEEAKRRGAYVQPEYSPLERADDKRIVLKRFLSSSLEEKKAKNVLEDLVPSLDSSLQNSFENTEKKVSKMELLMIENDKMKHTSSQDTSEIEHYNKNGKRELAQHGNEMDNDNSDHNKGKKRKIDNSFVDNDRRKEIIPLPPRHKHRENDWWILKNLIVKVLHKTLGEGLYFNKKGKIINIENKYVAYVQMLEGGDVIKVDQESLQTVIPNIDGDIRVILGDYRDHIGKLKSVDYNNYCVSMIVHRGPIFDKNPKETPFYLGSLPYEYVCKISL